MTTKLYADVPCPMFVCVSPK